MSNPNDVEHVRSILEAADPLRSEPALSEAEAAAMRRSILASARRESDRPGLWRGALAVAAVVLLMVLAGTQAGRRFGTRELAREAERVKAPAAADERRQVQFATPGGTRIIWTLDPDFKLREVVP